jgi:tRNA dimethylallyltransferase
MGTKPAIIAIGGPTGSGKTKLAIQLAELTGWEIISYDARQFYREMSIGTARPDPEELIRAKHHFIASHTILEPLDAKTYAEEASVILTTELQSKSGCILVGGSGFYAQSLLWGLDDMPSANPEIRANIVKEWDSGKKARLLEELKQCDPARYAEIDHNNPVRIIRALEIWRSTGIKPSDYQSGLKELRFDAALHWIWPVFDRDTLRIQLKNRLEHMLNKGLLEEVKSLEPFKELSALRTVGYREWYEGREKGLTDSEILEDIVHHTWQYAKRQVTWFKRYSPTALSQDKEELKRFLINIDS